MDEKTNQIMISQGYKNAASFISQKNILEGLEVETGRTFDSINVLSMTGYPRQGGLKIAYYKFSHALGSEDVLVGYLNIIYVNKLFMKYAMIKAVKQWIKKRYQKGEELDVFVYEMRSACLDAAVYLKKKIPSARIHLIIPDLPCFMDLNMSRIKECLKKIDWNQMIKKFVYVNNFLVYTETMVDYLNIRDKRWMVMEGSLNKRDIDEITSIIGEGTNKEKTSKRIVMYSGWIDEKFGINELVDAMIYLDDSYELWITGGGTYADNLQEKVLHNKKVKYYGFLSSRSELLKLQSMASVMLNIRNPEFESAHYCFPSKLFEYMLLGVPVLSVKLRGIPKEYKKYLFEVENLEPKTIAEAIKSIIEDPNSKKKAEDGKKFIVEKKNNMSVAKKIIEFIEE